MTPRSTKKGKAKSSILHTVNYDCWFINYFSKASEQLSGRIEMRKSLYVVPGIILLALGTLVFYIYSETKVLIEVSLFSFVLVTVFVLGLVLLGFGLANSIADRIS